MISIMRASRRYPLFLLFAACATLGSGKEFTLGLLIPYHELPHSKVSGVQGMYYAPSIIQALEDVNNRSDLLPGHHLSFIWNNTKCDETQSIQALTYLVHEKHVSAIIGPACSCKTEARLASALDIPMVSYMCNEPLYDSVKYSSFARSKVQVEFPKLSRSLVMLLRKFNWNQVAVVYENSSYYIRIKDSVVKEFEKSNINVRIQKSLLTFK